MHHIDLGTRRISFVLLRGERKSLRIEVHPDGKVKATAPPELSETKVLATVKKKARWIIKQQLLFDSFNPRTATRRYISGESHRYLGRQYTLKVIKSNDESIRVTQGRMHVSSADTSSSNVEKIIHTWYKKRANEVFPELLTEVMTKFKKQKLSAPNLVIRRMIKRWGSYTTNGKMILNLDLIKAKKACIEYVIVHELCHAVHPNHTNAFYRLLNYEMPEWKKWKDQLERSLA